MATLLPVPEQQWIDGNGNPLAGGSIYTYVPGTTTPKQTWQDSGGLIQNTNPIVLDAAGRALIYGSGSYRFVVNDSAGNLVYDQQTSDTAVGGLAWGGTSTGTPNAQVIAASSFTQQDGQQISFLVGSGLTNTGATTVSPGGGGGIAVLKDTVTGPTALTGGELAAGNAALLTYDSVRGAFHLVNQPSQIIPPGAIWMFGMNTAPAGWLSCDGSAVSRATYANLFAAVGTTFGAGNGSTTFNVPPNGYFPRMWNGSGSGIDPSRTFGSTQTDQNAAHTHTGTTGNDTPDHTHNFGSSTSAGGGTIPVGSTNTLSGTGTTAGANSRHQHPFTTASSGGTEARPQNIAFLFGIKT